MSDTDEIVVKVESDAPSKPDQEVVVKQEQPDAIAELKAQYDELQQKETAASERAASEAQRANTERQRREAAERETETARTEAAEGRAGSIDAGVSAAQTAATAAKAEYAKAMAEGNWEQAADAHEKLADARYRIGRFDEAKADLEIAKTRQAPIEAPPRVADPVEQQIAYLLKNGRTEDSANWLRSHRDYVTDQRKNAKLAAADYDARAEGIALDSPEYFNHIEKYLGMKEAPEAKSNGAAKPNGTRRASAPVAPVQQSGDSGLNGGGGEVRLTAGEARSATDGTLVWNFDDPSGQKRFKKNEPIGIQEMARRKRDMQAQGLYDRTWVEQ